MQNWITKINWIFHTQGWHLVMLRRCSKELICTSRTSRHYCNSSRRPLSICRLSRLLTQLFKSIDISSKSTSVNRPTTMAESCRCWLHVTAKSCWPTLTTGFPNQTFPKRAPRDGTEKLTMTEPFAGLSKQILKKELKVDK